MNFIRKNLWSVQLLHHKDFQESVTKVFARMQRFLKSHNAGDLFSDSVVSRCWHKNFFLERVFCPRILVSQFCINNFKVKSLVQFGELFFRWAMRPIGLFLLFYLPIRISRNVNNNDNYTSLYNCSNSKPQTNTWSPKVLCRSK